MKKLSLYLLQLTKHPETSGGIIQSSVKIIISHTCQVQGPCFMVQAASNKRQATGIFNHEPWTTESK